MNKLTALMIGAVGLVVAAGCTSICSTMLEKNPCSLGWMKTRSRGVPITLKVVTHVDVVITETKWLRKVTVEGVEQFEYIKDPSFECTDTCVKAPPLMSLNVTYSNVMTDKVFTVDPKRPAAGTANYDMGFNGQYFQNFTGNIEDTTINDISTAVEKILTAAGELATNKADGVRPFAALNLEAGDATPVTSVRASARFALDDPDVHHQISSFVSQHLSCPSGDYASHHVDASAEDYVVIPHGESLPGAARALAPSNRKIAASPDLTPSPSPPLKMPD